VYVCLVYTGLGWIGWIVLNIILGRARGKGRCWSLVDYFVYLR